MTIEDQDAEVGRLVRERRELRAHHEALVARGKKMGTLLAGMGQALVVHPVGSKYPAAHVVIENNGTVNVPDQYSNNKMIGGVFPSANELRELLDEIQAVHTKLAGLDASLKAFGV